MNTQSIINNLPDQAKRNVLSSLVGSLNASIIGTAGSVVNSLLSKDIDPREVEPCEVELLMLGADEDDSRLHNVRSTVRVAQALRDQLSAVTNDDELGTIPNTIDFMTQPSRRRIMTDDPEIKLLMSSLNLSETDIKLAEAAQASSDALRAEQLAQRRGAIEWIIENVFTAHSHDVTSADGKVTTVSDVDSDQIENLPRDAQERLFTKLNQILKRERDNTIRGVLFKDSRYSFGDLPLIDAAIKDAKLLDAHNEE